MPRKPRIEFPGAVYHILSRGNYRKDLFSIGKSGTAFEKTLFEVTERCSWKLHAYVIMRNHYHLAVELTEPNLVEGMRWLQSTFANRFNKFTGERGHVFQGRYKSILIEPNRPLLGLINYIHLNPVRAGIMSVENLKQYTLSSFPGFFKKQLSSGLVRSRFLSQLCFPDSSFGMKRYHEYLAVCDESDAKRKEELSRTYCRGWILAGKAFRKHIVETYVDEPVSRKVGASCLKELKEAQWEQFLEELLKKEGKTKAATINEPKGTDWKIRIAKTMRRQTTATNPWLADRLNMGHPSRVSNLIHGNI